MTCQQKIIDIINNLNIGDLNNRGTDKISWHSYDQVYGPVLDCFTHKQGTLLEIGTYHGASAVLWRYLLPAFRLELIDINPANFVNAYSPLLTNTGRKHGDAYTEQIVHYYRQLHPSGYEIIIDDGPHSIESQLYTVQHYTHLLKPGGVLIIEDIAAIENVDALIRFIPPGYTYRYFDLRSTKNRYDDIALVIFKNSDDLEL